MHVIMQSYFVLIPHFLPRKSMISSLFSNQGVGCWLKYTFFGRLLGYWQIKGICFALVVTVALTDQTACKTVKQQHIGPEHSKELRPHN